jgi:hypothetical protein
MLTARVRDRQWGGEKDFAIVSSNFAIVNSDFAERRKVFTMKRNRCSRSSEMGVHVRAKYA